MLAQLAVDHYREQQQLQARLAARVGRHWQAMGADFVPSWARIRDVVYQDVFAASVLAAESSAAYAHQMAAETGVGGEPRASIVTTAFASVTESGASLDTVLELAPMQARTAVERGQSPAGALRTAGAWLTMVAINEVTASATDAVQTTMAVTPQMTGYVRMLNPPSCSDCAILAGKWFRWNEGFQRHPRCDCRHIPVGEDAAGDVRTDPYAYFNSLPVAEQARVFGTAEAEAIRSGADIYRVVNIRKRGVGGARAGRIYGTPTKLTARQIIEQSTSRAHAYALLEEHGYITGPQVRGGNIFGRFNEPFAVPISRPLVPGSARERVLQARATGQRNPLDRATMTAAERRLFDANYRLEYARRYGAYPTSIGLNSADTAARVAARKLQPGELDMLEERLQSEIAAIRPRDRSLISLARELGLTGDNDPSVVFRRIEAFMATIPVPGRRR